MRVKDDELVHVDIVGLWGRIGKKLVNPNNPESMPVVVWVRDGLYGRHRVAYFPEVNKCYEIDEEDNIKKKFAVSKTVAKKLKQYLKSGDVRIDDHWIHVTSTQIKSQSRKLKARWSIEAAPVASSIYNPNLLEQVRIR